MKKLPKTVKGIGGPIKIVLLPKLEKTDAGEELVGRWFYMTRTIQISSDQTVREQWRTLYHELVHAALHDSGMHNLLVEDSEESICDLIGMARMLEDGL